MRRFENKSLEKCLVSYWLINLELFHPEQRNFDQKDTIFLDTREKILFLRFEIIVFFNLTQACGAAHDDRHIFIVQATAAL